MDANRERKERKRKGRNILKQKKNQLATTHDFLWIFFIEPKSVEKKNKKKVKEDDNTFTKVCRVCVCVCES